MLENILYITCIIANAFGVYNHYKKGNKGIVLFCAAAALFCSYALVNNITG